MNDQYNLPLKRMVLLAVVGLSIIVALFFGLGAVGKAYSRYQKREDAKNLVKVTATQIQVAEQQAKVNSAQIEATKAEAEKRYQEAIGIRRSQDEISKTLTPMYLQFLAIEAQKAMATGNNHSEIYIPSGENGVPLVKTTGP